MESGKKRCHSVSASSGIVFTDAAKARNQRGANRENSLLIRNLRNRERWVDISAAIDEDRRWEAAEDATRKGEAPPQYDHPPRQCVWDGCRRGLPEKLYRFSRARHGKDRWVLAYQGRDDLLNRELTPEQAAYWILRINGYALPPDLGSITTATTDDAYPRLRPDWRPGPEPPTGRKPPVVLGGPDDPVWVWGKEKDPLPPAEFRVLKALVEATAKGRRLSMDCLHTATKDKDGNKVEDPVGALKRLRRRDADWESVIHMAESPGRGYGLRDKPPTPTQKNLQNHPRRPTVG
jgi:hypothetical protein